MVGSGFFALRSPLWTFRDATSASVCGWPFTATGSSTRSSGPRNGSNPSALKKPSIRSNCAMSHSSFWILWAMLTSRKTVAGGFAGSWERSNAYLPDFLVKKSRGAMRSNAALEFVLHGWTRACSRMCTGGWTQFSQEPAASVTVTSLGTRTTVCRRDKLLPALERLKEVLRPRAHALAPMPADESVAYEIVTNEPWMAYNWYQGQHRSRVQVNADLPISILLLVDLAAHEAYPGHHTERTAKDAHLVRDLGRVETSVAITLAPEALVSEGIARNALEEALGSAPFAAVADALADMDLRFDPIEADEIHRAEMELYGPATNAAFMLHEDRASTKEAEDYVREWCLESDERAARDVAFIADPEAHAYMPAYTEGRRLCRDFADRDPGNFTRLLTEQLTTADLLS